MNVRVLHVHSGKLGGDTGAFLAVLARRRDLVPELEAEFALCFDGRLRRELEGAGAKVVDLGAVRLRTAWSVVRARRALRRLLAERKYDVVVCHATWSQAVFGGVPRTLGVPEVFYAHDRVRPEYLLERWAARHPPDWSLANSESTRRELAALFPVERASVLYYPVELREAMPSAAERRAIRAELGFLDDTVVIVQASGMQPEKGQAELLKALARLPPPTSWFCLEIGDTQRRAERAYRARLEEQARALGVTVRVRFLGERDDVQRLLAAADIYCQPNAEPEAFGVGFVQALQAGLPVVTFDSGGPREIVTDEVGLLVANERGLVGALAALVRDAALRTRLGASGPARARELCDPATRLRELASVLERVVGSPGAAPSLPVLRVATGVSPRA